MLDGNVLGTFLWKVFLLFSECLCGSFPHNCQGIFTDHLTSGYPIFAHHPQFMQTIFNLIYSGLFHVLCGTMLNMLITDTLWETFLECPQRWNCPNLVRTYGRCSANVSLDILATISITYIIMMELIWLKTKWGKVMPLFGKVLNWFIKA